MSNASRDQNNVPTLLGVSNVDGSTPVTIYADPTTHRLLIDLPALSQTVVMAADAVNGSLGTFFQRTLAGSETFTQSGFTTGQNFTIEVIQGSGTSYTVTWFSGITWVTSGGTAPTQTTASNGITLYGFRCTGTNTFLGWLVATQ